MFKKSIVLILCLGLFLSNLDLVKAQNFSIDQLPLPGSLMSPSEAFVPILLKGLVIHPDKPFNFDFIVDSGNDLKDQTVIKEQSQRMIRYFLAALTVPANDLWVNLSPYEHNRVIPNELGQTLLGRDMLAQDYVLKQMTASLMNPEKELGSAFWSRVYKKVKIKTGRTDMPVNTFNKVWIVPNGAEVFEKGNAVYITQAKLKVMLDEDYLVLSRHKGLSEVDNSHALGNQVIKDIVLPEIEKEVNEGRNFSVLRQIYHAAILAKWYREAVQKTLFSQVYFDKNKISGVDLDDKTLKEKIYQRYIAAYKKGVFNHIREDRDELTGAIIPRKYFSGGTVMSPAMISLNKIKRRGVIAGALSLVLARAKVVKAQRLESPVAAGDLLVKQKYSAEYGQLNSLMFFPGLARAPQEVQKKTLAEIKEDHHTRITSMLWFDEKPFSWPTYPQREFNNYETTITFKLKRPELFDPEKNTFLIGIKNKGTTSPIRAVISFIDSEGQEQEHVFILVNPNVGEASRYIVHPRSLDRNGQQTSELIRITKITLSSAGNDPLFTPLDICILIPYRPFTPPVIPPSVPPEAPPVIPPAEGPTFLVPPPWIPPWTLSPWTPPDTPRVPVPEPATLGVLAVGLTGLAYARSRRKPSVDKNGGIDLNQININHKSNADHFSFDAAQMNDLKQVGFKGLTPSIIKIIPISNPTKFFEELTI